MSWKIGKKRIERKNFRKNEKKTCILKNSVVVYRSCPERYVLERYPGVAKFGIALEWGSRGLEFESQHSDQNAVNESSQRFLLCAEM